MLQVAGSGVAAVGSGMLRFIRTGWFEHLSEKLLRFTQIYSDLVRDMKT